MSELLESNGRTLETTLTDDEAAAACGRVPREHRDWSFANSLATDFARYGRLFPNKRFWMHRKAIDQLEREREADALLYGDEPTGFSAGAEGQFPGIVAFFAPAGPHLKRPKITLISGAYTVTFKRVAEKTRYPGNYLIWGMSGYGEKGTTKTALGRIDPLGFWFPSDAGRADPVSQSLLDLFNESPRECVERYASDTECCFCAQALTDPISKEMKYGPVCAKHYALPWSQEAAAEKRMRCAAAS